MDFIIADESGKEVGYIDVNKEVDMDIGGTNDYAMTVALSDWDRLGYNYGYRLYIPDTEYGGFVQNIKTDSRSDEAVISGLTWRGLLTCKIIEPPPGQAYKTVSGEANAVLKAMLDGLFGDIFIVPESDSGITITSYQFDRYTDLLSGLTKMLYANNARLKICYRSGDSKGAGYAELQAVPIADYSDELEFSEDSKVSFITQDVRNGINHLICLGKGELEDREVVHLYVQSDGNIGQTPFYTGLDERTAVYNYGNAETRDELIKGGIDRLKSLMDYKRFDMCIGYTVADIGDIVGGREYTTGFLIRQQISEKIIKISNEDISVEYRVGGADKALNGIGGGSTSMSELTIAEVLNQVYPIGSIYISMSGVNPSRLFGGTWDRIADGRVLVGINPNDGDFDTAGKIGGNKSEDLRHTHTVDGHTHTIGHTHIVDGHNHGIPHTHVVDSHSHTTANHTLTVTEMPNHSHGYGTSAEGSLASAGQAHGTAYNMGSYQTTGSGGGQPHNHGNTGNTSPSTGQPSIGTTENASPNTSDASNANSGSANPGTDSQLGNTSNLQPYYVCYIWMRTA